MRKVSREELLLREIFGEKNRKERRKKLMAQITVSEALGLMKTLRARYDELKALRSDNAHKERHFYGTAGDKAIDKDPVYDVKALDKTVNRIAMEIRKLDTAIKAHNALSKLENYEWDEELLGIIEMK